jgi:hypothetical protein
MPEFCTCGAQLTPDALFCHKCGKAQRELVEPETVVTPPEPGLAAPPLPPAAPAQLPLNFHNPIAVRIALLVAITATVLSLFLPLVPWIAAGFFADFFYRRRTGSLLNVTAGVRMGWITGIIMFALTAIGFTAQQLPVALSGRLATAFQEQIKNFPGQDPKMVEQMVHFFQTGPGIAAMFALSLVGLFLFITGSSIAGGALGAFGAKMMGRSS